MPHFETASSAAGVASSDDSYDATARILVLGDSAVGKSSLLMRFCENRFDSNFVITIGVDFRVKTINIQDREVRLQIWDTAGQERFRTITPAYYRNAMGVLLIYDMTDSKSFKNVDYWVRNLDEHADKTVQKLLVGNKADMAAKRKVSTEEGQALADKYGMTFFETSAKSGLNVEQAFRAIAERVCDSYDLLNGIEPRVHNNGSVASSNAVKLSDRRGTGGAGEFRGAVTVMD
ncbi:RAS small GTpases RIC1/ypt1, putative [Perkinsus marinus ATCC 50983]|uniref:Ras-related protein Rab-1 n=1 Tax=Perkinsus marinus (strain ATCC 50983 / TXsc) TaxID=423536 RepID=C5L3R7_PERM5|nr:RAS small GTpases RIC1/ypt1, putative [Perkinsus marinus ATCC 50983]EER08646.1 RAS small GTpases RIC1/ypt1, putative [Perkinsus marinus ATCC 50983]|eukprot:XP_002776830.1 RAS small GTpases RIC1/ypt1, putative [Perkinsus marinus ATCC 50983]